jgi:hypothetical protein
LQECEFCQKGFNKKKALTEHKKICAKNEENEPVYCEFCQLPFRGKKSLNNHLKFSCPDPDRVEERMPLETQLVSCAYCGELLSMKK